MNTEERLNNLEREVNELKTWKNERIRQQISFPLDEVSKKIILKDTFIVKDLLNFTRANGVVFPFGVTTINNDKLITLSTLPTLHIYTTDSSDLITSVNHGFDNDDQVTVISSDVVPAGLAEGTKYYVINSTPNTLKLSLTSGGAAVNITDSGTGTQYIYFY